MNRKKRILLINLCLTFFNHHAADTDSSLYIMAKRGELSELRSFHYQNERPETKEGRDLLIRRIILTGNPHIVELFFNKKNINNKKILHKSDISDEHIDFARERALINNSNRIILRFLIAQQSMLLKQKELLKREKILEDQAISPVLKRKRKPLAYIPKNSFDINICLICKDKFTNHQPKKKAIASIDTTLEEKILDCGHPYHEHCIRAWFNTIHNTKCPLCQVKHKEYKEDDDDKY